MTISPGAMKSENRTPSTVRPARPSATVKIARYSSVVIAGAQTVCIWTLKKRPSPLKPDEEKEHKPAAASPAPAAAAHKPAPRADAPVTSAAPAATPAHPTPKPRSHPEMQYRSIGPGGFIRQGPGDQQPPIPPAPPRRLVPAKPSPEVADKTSLLDLNDRICKWPMGHPGEPDFHFCGQAANPGFPYCVQHCGVAYQAQLPRRDRRPPPPLPFGGPRVR